MHFFKLKPLTIGLLLILLWIPLQMISSLIAERYQMSLQVHTDITESSSRAQWLAGPMLVIETEQYLPENSVNPLAVKAVTHYRFILPSQLNLESQLRTEIRSRGIYETRLYHTNNTLKARYELPAQLGFEQQPELSPASLVGNIKLKSARLVMGISDVRGLNGMPQLQLNQQSLKIAPGTGFDALSGIHALLDLQSLLDSQHHDLTLNLDLTGTDNLSVLPIADATAWALTADWPHPSFSGYALPFQHQIREDGFKATWQSTQFANNVQANISKCLVNDQRCELLQQQSFSVGLVEPVDHYLQSNRAVKYALLVLVVSFAVFYLFEILAKLMIHPMQYLFVGLALAMFYLLLISLSEVVGFAWAYAIAATACVLLCSAYTIAVLKSRYKGVTFACGLALLYSLLFMILRAEDMALLAGSLLLFVVLSAVMLSTRHLNWYQLQDENRDTATSSSPE